MAEHPEGLDLSKEQLIIAVCSTQVPLQTPHFSYIHFSYIPLCLPAVKNMPCPLYSIPREPGKS